jgi:twitching motility two-component system response regulator PilG
MPNNSVDTIKQPTNTLANTVPQNQSAGGETILVIDDSNTIRRSAEIFLKQGGYQVLLAEDGYTGLAMVNDHRPDLILCDVLMPKLDGFQTCALLRQSELGKNLPIIMLSSKDGLFDRARGLMVGANHYMTKPFTKESLIKTIEHCLTLDFKDS